MKRKIISTSLGAVGRAGPGEGTPGQPVQLPKTYVPDCDMMAAMSTRLEIEGDLWEEGHAIA